MYKGIQGFYAKQNFNQMLDFFRWHFVSEMEGDAMIQLPFSRILRENIFCCLN